MIRDKMTYSFRILLPVGRHFAEIIKRALDPENYVYIKLKVKEEGLMVECESDSAGSLLHTIDDFFWCFSIAYSTLLDIKNKKK
ncbi:MAG: hypothetical protein DRN26_04660 [Thermoplasmata archaeon]|nr:hypothetical protein [Euryarchaeota archaeon]RLF65955.1 MAG: hypothetical protein DRN26_04660 [Thermoplasmata archaeon]